MFTNIVMFLFYAGIGLFFLAMLFHFTIPFLPIVVAVCAFYLAAKSVG